VPSVLVTVTAAWPSAGPGVSWLDELTSSAQTSPGFKTVADPGLVAVTLPCVILTFSITADASSTCQSMHGPRAATFRRSLFRLSFLLNKAFMCAS